MNVFGNQIYKLALDKLPKTESNDLYRKCLQLFLALLLHAVAALQVSDPFVLREACNS